MEDKKDLKPKDEYVRDYVLKRMQGIELYTPRFFKRLSVARLEAETYWKRNKNREKRRQRNEKEN